MKAMPISLLVVLLLLALGLSGCNHQHALHTVVVPRDTDAPTNTVPDAPAEQAPATPTVTLRPTEPQAGAPASGTVPPPSPILEPAEAPAPPTQPPPPQLPACCTLAAPGQGWLWFDNHVGEIVSADVGLNCYEIPAKQGEVAGCLCPPLDPGRYAIILHTGTHEIRLEVDIVAGRVEPFVVYYEGH